MAPRTLQGSGDGVWELARRQHGVVTRAQLIGLGFTPEAIRHRISTGRLHPMWPGVYAVGRAQVSRLGIWMAATLTCGPEAALSYGDAAAVLGIGKERQGVIEVSVPARVRPRPRSGITVHRRTALTPSDVTRRHGIPVTTPVCTLVDQATRLPRRQLEAAISEADKLGLTNPPALRSALAALNGRPGAPRLREILDRHTFRLTRSDLERRFLPLVRRAGLETPETQQRVNGFRVDFYWPDLGLVVETDGITYHRTPAQQAKDRVRDQAHTAAGLTPLRFTHEQIKYEPHYVEHTLGRVARRLIAAV